MSRPTSDMTNAEYGAWLAEQAPPLSPEAIDQAARVYVSWLTEQELGRSA